MYKIHFYRDKSGKEPVIEYMKGLASKKDKENTCQRDRKSKKRAGRFERKRY